MISQKSANVVILTNVVYDIAKNRVHYYGDEKSCLELEFSDDRFLSFEIGGIPPVPPPQIQ